MVLLLVGNFLQVGAWVLVFVQLDEFSSLIEAFYHSAVDFSTLGYDVVILPACYRTMEDTGSCVRRFLSAADRLRNRSRPAIAIQA
jgi:hypothetical protein